MQKKVIYSPNGLTIHIPTNSPATLHEQLLRGICASFKNHIVNPPDNGLESETIAYLADIQQALIPTEQELKKAFE